MDRRRGVAARSKIEFWQSRRCKWVRRRVAGRLTRPHVPPWQFPCPPPCSYSSPPRPPPSHPSIAPANLAHAPETCTFTRREPHAHASRLLPPRRHPAYRSSGPDRRSRAVSPVIIVRRIFHCTALHEVRRNIFSYHQRRPYASRRFPSSTRVNSSLSSLACGQPTLRHCDRKPSPTPKASPPTSRPA